MKFACGATWQVKEEAKRKWRRDWHRHFALIPHRIADRECRWLEYIERKGTPYSGRTFGGPPRATIEKWRYEYRAISYLREVGE